MIRLTLLWSWRTWKWADPCHRSQKLLIMKKLSKLLTNNRIIKMSMKALVRLPKWSKIKTRLLKSRPTLLKLRPGWRRLLMASLYRLHPLQLLNHPLRIKTPLQTLLQMVLILLLRILHLLTLPHLSRTLLSKTLLMRQKAKWPLTELTNWATAK